MGFRYHASALIQDTASHEGCIFGAANIEVVRHRIAERKAKAVAPAVEHAVEQLASYFAELSAPLGQEALLLIKKQELDGEMLSDEEASALQQATRNRPKTTISKAEAERLARFIADSTRDWGD